MPVSNEAEPDPAAGSDARRVRSRLPDSSVQTMNRTSIALQALEGAKAALAAIMSWPPVADHRRCRWCICDSAFRI